MSTYFYFYTVKCVNCLVFWDISFLLFVFLISVMLGFFVDWPFVNVILVEVDFCFLLCVMCLFAFTFSWRIFLLLWRAICNLSLFIVAGQQNKWLRSNAVGQSLFFYFLFKFIFFYKSTVTCDKSQTSRTLFIGQMHSVFYTNSWDKETSGT